MIGQLWRKCLVCTSHSICGLSFLFPIGPQNIPPLAFQSSGVGVFNLLNMLPGTLEVTFFDSLNPRNQQAAPILPIGLRDNPTNPSSLLYPGYHYFGWHFCHLLPELNLKTCNWPYCFISSSKYGQKFSLQNTNLIQSSSESYLSSQFVLRAHPHHLHLLSSSYLP